MIGVDANRPYPTSADTILVGVDGCPDGWVIARQSGQSGRIECLIVPSLGTIFDESDLPAVVAIDIPIGLPPIGARACDVAARRALGPRRGSSVFPAPLRSLLDARSQADASERRFKIEGKRVSIQAWAIVSKICQVDDFVRSNPGLRERIKEVHPEVCFFAMNENRPVEISKKKVAGRSERIELLRRHFGDQVDVALDSRKMLGRCHPDDVIDAFAALWTARRISNGVAIRFPETDDLQQHDDLGLEMAILA